MNGNGKGPMNNGPKTGRQLGYCAGFENAGFENTESQNRREENAGFGNRNKRGQNIRFGNGNGNGKRFMQGFGNDIEYTQIELLSLRKSRLQAELEIIEEKLKNL